MLNRLRIGVGKDDRSRRTDTLNAELKLAAKLLEVEKEFVIEGVRDRRIDFGIKVSHGGLKGSDTVIHDG